MLLLVQVFSNIIWILFIFEFFTGAACRPSALPCTFASPLEQDIHLELLLVVWTPQVQTACVEHASGPTTMRAAGPETSLAFKVQQMLTVGACAGCVLLANSAFVQASLLWITLTPIIFKFNRYCKLRFGEARFALHALANQCALACTGQRSRCTCGWSQPSQQAVCQCQVLHHSKSWEPVL